MKQGWEIKKLEELAIKLFAGGDKPKVFSEHPTDVLNIPVYANGVSFDGLVGYTDKATVEKESITVSARGTIGFCCVRRTPFVPIVRLITIIPIESIKTEFLYYALSNATIENNGVAIPQLTIPMIKGITIPIPSLAEQERIVEVLDREFERIDAMKANAEQNLQHAKDLFQAALRQELQPKDGWEQHLLADVCEYKKEQGYYTHLPFVGMENIESGTGKLIGCQNGEKILSTTFRFQKGFVMYGRLRPYLKKVFVADFEGCCSTEIFPIVVNGVLPNLLMYWFLSDFTTDKINATCGGCRMPRANMNVVKQFYIWLPLLEEQEQIVARLDNLNERCKALEENHKKTIALCDDMKQALLRKAFNGEL